MPAVNFSLLVFTPPSGLAVNFELNPTPAHRTLFSFVARGKIGRPDLPNPHGHFGIYQIRHTLKGPRVIRMKFYTPTNPQTVPQQANRTKFANAMAAWQSLTEEEKGVYRKRAKKRSMFGWGLFIREYFINN